MFTLYLRWDAERELAPGDIQFILSPRDALNMAGIFYELDYLEYDQRNRILPHSVPKRRRGVYHRYATQPYKRKRLTEYDGLYDEVKWNLEHGWMVGVDTNEKWEHFRNPFYFDDDSNLIYNCFMDTYSEGFQQAVRQIYEYSLNEHQGRKPPPTIKHHYADAPIQRAQADKTINSKAAGRLLAAGGIYNGNIEGFRQTAEQLGGDAVKGYDGILNETTSGMMVAAASLLVIRNPMAAEELTSYLGKYKKAHVLLDDVNVSNLNYVRRDRTEYAVLRRDFNSSVRPSFLKSLSDHPDALSTFDSNNLLRLAEGKVPSGWQVHHKIPLDDSGTNALDNLILIQNSPYHSTLSKTQAIITKDLPYNASTNVVWPSPNGVIYPVGK
ncbi:MULTISPECIES: HNH endonuclease signature motif containing protein [Enterobacter]|uniref:HNH endonuclease signature motif containing protein n=1 Tax=Enterobacter TaxID=547 RepID=UPI0028E68205|nr:HNH endonuclease signature motif containing protein [Enterobacter cloacae]WNT38174.1 HNH endonuclease signature motif containing protein [Enterobacter cloacae]HDR2793989.1 HNH endonuclease [Enterobacter asburiae]HDR2799230.1 HNH endonuclease [Enterobacter asburiae]